MKLINKNLEKNGTGSITLVPDQPDDMWHAYNLIAVGDHLRGSAIRKVQTESSTGSTDSNRVRTVLTIDVTQISFDEVACTMRVSGRNVEENPYVKMGAHHTLDLEPNRKFTLMKDCWDVVALERVDLCCDPAKTADVAAVVMQEGLAQVCLVTSAMTIVRGRIDMNIARKRKESSQHEKDLVKFYDVVMQTMLRHINFDIIKVLIVASPGFVKDQFYKHIMDKAIRSDLKVLIENKSKIVCVHSSSGHKHALQEAMSDVSIASRISDTKAAAEVLALDTFHKMLNSEPDRAFYGYNHVRHALDHGAVEVLLVTDTLFRSKSVATRRKYVSLVEDTKDNNGVVHIFSSLHTSGDQLTQLGGIAAILRFPLPGIEDEDDEEEASNGDN